MPANVIYPPTVPPTSVTIDVKLMVDGIIVFFMTSPTGGCVLNAIYNINSSITTPSSFTNQSIALAASFIKNKRILIIALIRLPVSTLTGNKILKPRPQPEILPILNASPPRQMKMVSRCPLPGRTSFASSDPFLLLAARICQIFSWR